jgi:opacity protein-like surface antigen
MRAFLATAILLAGVGPGIYATAAAADGPPGPGPYLYAGPAYPVHDWSGLYVGGQAGIAKSHIDWTFTSPTEAFDQGATSFAGGVQAGLQKQWSSTVLGVEVSYTWADFEDTSASGASPGETRTSRISNLFLLTGRLGYAFENWHAYAKGGYAAGEVEFRSNDATGALLTSSSGREHGWTAGLGIDYALTPSISVGVEYNFIHLNADPRDLIPTGAGLAGSQAIDGSIDIQMLAARLNFTFGPGREPLPPAK